MNLFIKRSHRKNIAYVYHEKKKFVCFIGKNGIGSKKREGDLITPKGKFNQKVIPYHIDVCFYIELHCKFPTWKDFVETLAHEMVHLYQMTWLKDPYSNHNANFFAWKNKFKLAGLNLSRC